MAHFAVLDENNVVLQVITGNDDDGVHDWELMYSEATNRVCKRTSFNTHGGVHVLGGIPYRKNYAGIDYLYDPERDAFIPPKPTWGDWILDEFSCTWVPSV